MKDYFSRLAERAVADAPIFAPPAAPLADPFDVVEPVLPPLPASSRSVSVAEPPVQVTQPAPRLAPTPDVPVPPVQRIPPPVPPEVIETVTRHTITEKRTVVDEVVEEKSILMPPVPAPAPPTREAAPREAAEREEPRAEGEEREEVRLLRKADAFMEQLMGRRERAAPDRRSETVIEERTEVVQTQPEPIARLQPAPPQPASREPESERSSLTIGRLTVEVVPSAPPAPFQQQPQVIIVRGGRGARSSGIPSIRRFGLRQF
jgi:hypothetical protein